MIEHFPQYILYIDLVNTFIRLKNMKKLTYLARSVEQRNLRLYIKINDNVMRIISITHKYKFRLKAYQPSKL